MKNYNADKLWYALNYVYISEISNWISCKQSKENIDNMYNF